MLLSGTSSVDIFLYHCVLSLRKKAMQTTEISLDSAWICKFNCQKSRLPQCGKKEFLLKLWAGFFQIAAKGTVMWYYTNILYLPGLSDQAN